MARHLRFTITMENGSHWKCDTRRTSLVPVVLQVACISPAAHTSCALTTESYQRFAPTRRPGCLRNRAFRYFRPHQKRKRSLGVVVQRELVRMRPERHRSDFLLALVVDPRLDQLFAEHVALEHEVVIGFERVQRFAERARRLRHLLQPVSYTHLRAHETG